MARLKVLETQMLAVADEQVSLTDPDARSMAASGRGSGVVGYNVQAAVETEHHLIIAHDVIQSGSDRASLAPMAKNAEEALSVDELDVVADRGYFSSEQILECSQADVTVTLLEPMTAGVNANGQFGKPDFRYVSDDDVYICPAGQTLSFVSHKRQSDRPNLRRYATEACLHASASRDGRAFVRYDQDVHGCDALLDEAAAKRLYRNGTVRARLQSDPCHQYSRDCIAHPGDLGVDRSYSVPKKYSFDPDPSI